MSKFYKFKNLLDREETIDLIRHLTGETIDQIKLYELLDSGFLSTIVGADKVLVGFTEEEAMKIASGSTGKPSIFSSIGIPWGDRSGVGFLDSDFIFHGAYTKSGERFLFAGMTPGLIGRPYSKSDLESLGTFLAENCSFLTQEVYEVSNAANNNSAIVLKKEISERKISQEDGADLLYVTGITDMPFAYHPTYAPAEIIQNITRTSSAERPSQLLTVAALLEILIEQGERRLTQDFIASSIEDKYKGVRGLGSTTVKTLFAEAKKALKAAQGDQQT